jgi:hypothetical protein
MVASFGAWVDGRMNALFGSEAKLFLLGWALTV